MKDNENKKFKIKDLLPFWKKVEEAIDEADKKGKGLDSSMIVLLRPSKEKIPCQFGGKLKKINGEIYFLADGFPKKSFGGGTEVIWFGIYVASNATSNTPYICFM